MSNVQDEKSVESEDAELTVPPDTPTEVEDYNEEPEMADDPRLLEVFDLIRSLIADERAKTIADMLKGANAPSGVQIPASGHIGKTQRAPSGSARILCQRTLGAAGHNGLTTLKIQELAESQYEKMLTMSAIRNELGTGEKAKPPRYRNVGGVWYLADYAPLMKVVSN